MFWMEMHSRLLMLSVYYITPWGTHSFTFFSIKARLLLCHVNWGSTWSERTDCSLLYKPWWRVQSTQFTAFLSCVCLAMWGSVARSCACSMLWNGGWLQGPEPQTWALNTSVPSSPSPCTQQSLAFCKPVFRVSGFIINRLQGGVVRGWCEV